MVHVGANNGEEIPWYLHRGMMPVLAFEPNPDAFELLDAEFGSDPAVGCVQLALGKEHRELVLLNVPAGGTKGTSRYLLLKPEKLTTPVRAEVLRFDDWAEGRDMTAYDTLVVDVQGMEMEVLEGMGRYLDQFKFLNIECSEVPVYEGEAPAYQIVRLLTSVGFKQDTPIESHNDILFHR